MERVKSVADLSMLDILEDEYAKYAKEFDKMDEIIKRVQSVDLKNTTYELFVKEYGELREDEVKPSSSRSQTLKNAPVKDSLSFILPKVVD